MQVCGGGGTFRAFLNVGGREVLLGQFHDPETAAAAHAKAKAIRDEHARKGLPLTLAQLRGRPQGSSRSPLDAMANLFDPDPEPKRLAAKQKNHERMLTRRWRTWAPAHMDFARKVIEKAERRLYGKKGAFRGAGGPKASDPAGATPALSEVEAVKPAELAPAPGTEPAPTGDFAPAESAIRRSITKAWRA